MKKFVNTTTELPEDVLQELKEKSGRVALRKPCSRPYTIISIAHKPTMVIRWN